ncbi:MAG: SMI1/KNR4 family protein, partial [Planctomycetota bacterium]|nr:SMI1/KNR4 family protein [Planctomycetota bacterium]
MTSDTFMELETLCQAPVPTACRAVLTHYPEVLRGAVRADDGSDAEGFVSEAELLADPAEVLRINREVRQDSILDPEGNEFCWPEKFLVIGETGDGDYYCIDAAGGHEGVLQFRHHTVEFETVAESVADFIE